MKIGNIITTCKKHGDCKHAIYSYNGYTSNHCLECAKEKKRKRMNNPEKYKNDREYTRQWSNSHRDHINILLKNRDKRIKEEKEKNINIFLEENKEYFLMFLKRSCKEICKVKNDGTLIGSINCQTCDHCKDYDKDPHGDTTWIMCEKLDLAINTLPDRKYVLMKTKEEIEETVSDSVKPLINALGRYEDGPAPMEEYGTLYWTKSSVQTICQAVFDKTYDVIINDK